MAFSRRAVMASQAERALSNIFKRCVQCPSTTPTCPACNSTEVCSLVPQSCDLCAHMTCIANPNPTAPSGGTNIGAVAGGVIGGLIAIGLLVYLVWRFWIKDKRRQQELDNEEWAQDDHANKRSTRFTTMQSDTASTRTRASFAGSLLSRASNIIQIAYIPGVTNRDNGRDSILQSHPVPPIPAALRNANANPPKSPLANDGDMLFFSPRDLRGSTYSTTSTVASGNNRDTQYSRRSITPSLARASVASTIYHNDAQVEPMPAMPAARAIPRMVAVKGASPASTPSLGTPGSAKTPTAGASQFAANIPKGKEFQIMMPGSGSPNDASSGRNVGAFAKATAITVTKGPQQVQRQSSDDTLATVSSKHAPSVSSPLAEIAPDTPVSEDADENSRARRSLLGAAASVASPVPLVQPSESPFFDASETTPKKNPYASMGRSIGADPDTRRTIGGLSAVIEERRGSSSSAATASLLEGTAETDALRKKSPFGDEHATE